MIDNEKHSSLPRLGIIYSKLEGLLISETSPSKAKIEPIRKEKLQDEMTDIKHSSLPRSEINYSLKISMIQAPDEGHC